MPKCLILLNVGFRCSFIIITMLQAEIKICEPPVSNLHRVFTAASIAGGVLGGDEK